MQKNCDERDRWKALNTVRSLGSSSTIFACICCRAFLPPKKTTKIRVCTPSYIFRVFYFGEDCLPLAQLSVLRRVGRTDEIISGQSRKCIEPTKRQPLEARAVRLRFYRSLKLFRGILLSNLLLVFIKIERMKITVLNGKTGPIRIYVAHVCWFSLKISLRSLKFKFVTYVYTI